MEINATLLVQMFVFLVFVWFTMKFVWPPLSKAMEERQDKISEGLAAAERGRREFELTQHRAKDEIRQAKAQASEIIEMAKRRSSEMIETAKNEAREEAQRQAKIAHEQLQQEISKAKEILQKQVSHLAIVGAERILQKEVNKEASKKLVDDLIKEI
ncbi:F0F1 ATP synthase subunit B [Legionella sp. W05-934-2]|uniref:F0F1 ATP synthase subunit B n=1 Tax=Legionella sp. W05-934-2 TaxID=1198649 RepID=UPI0034623434